MKAKKEELSKDELIKELKELNSQLKQVKDDLAFAQKKHRKALAETNNKQAQLADIESKYKQSQEDNEALQKENKELKIQLEVHQRADEMVKEIIEQFSSDDLVKRFKLLTQEQASSVALAKELCKELQKNKELRDFLFGKHLNPAPNNSQNPQNPADAPNNSQPAEKKVTKSAADKALTKLATRVVTAAKAVDDVDSARNEVVKAMANNTEPVQTPTRNRRKNRGKSKKNFDNLPKKADAVEQIKQHMGPVQQAVYDLMFCRRCGAPIGSNFNTAMKIIYDHMSSSASVMDGSGAVKDEYQVMNTECPVCGFKDIEEYGNIAFLPGRNVSLNTAVHMALCVASGMTCSGFENTFMAAAKRGHSTVYSDFILIGRMLKPAYDMFNSMVDQSRVVHFDEVTFVVIDENGRHKVYICAKATGPNAENTAVVFGMPGSRSEVKEFVKAFCGSDTESKVMITDAMPSYITAAIENNIKHQLCLAHAVVKFNRVFNSYNESYLKPFDDPDYCSGVIKQIFSKTDEELLNASPHEKMALLAYIRHRLSCIFANDAAARELTEDNVDDFVKMRGKIRRENSSKIMQELKEFCEAVAPIFCPFDGNKYKVPKSILGNLDKGGEAVAYLLNHWDNFTVFLNDPEIECHNLSLERHNKVIAGCRSKGLFVRTEDGMASALHIILTVIYSAKQNGMSEKCGVGTYVYELARFARRVALTREHFRRYERMYGKDAKPDAKKGGRPNYSDPELYEGIVLPEFFKPKQFMSCWEHKDEYFKLWSEAESAQTKRDRPTDQT